MEDNNTKIENVNGEIRNESGRNPDGTFAVGNPGGPGRKPETEEQKLVKKAQKELIAEYKEKLAEALPLISPVLIAKAMEGDMSAIKEVNDRVMGKAEAKTDITSNGKDLIPETITKEEKEALLSLLNDKTSTS